MDDFQNKKVKDFKEVNLGEHFDVFRTHSTITVRGFNGGSSGT